MNGTSRDDLPDELGRSGMDDLETAGPDASAKRVSTEAFRQMPSSARGGALEAGKVFGPYRLVRLLGKGGFGQVWEAESLDTGRRVALKVLTIAPADDPDALRRFEREGQLAASLSHPNCVYMFGAQQIEGYPTITMELMAGGTLQDRLRTQRRLPVKQAVDLTLEVIEGLEAAHEAGIVHRDVKPSNCFLDGEGHAKIGDFGISRTLQGAVDLTVRGEFLGTPSYASPEQVKGQKLDLRSDIYSVGALLYALLTGQPPFTGNQAGEVLAKIVSEEPAPFSAQRVEVPKPLERIVLRRALAKSREKRYQDYASFRQALFPFSSRGLDAATMGRRRPALVLDLAMFLLIPFELLEALANQRVPWGLVVGAVIPALMFLYFVITETFWGQSLGKRAFGLRVTTLAGSAMSLGQACLRTAVFVGLLWAPVVLAEHVPWLGRHHHWPAGLLAWLALVSTMRRSNEYAGLHEILSKTRVRAVRGLAPVLRLGPQLSESERADRLTGPTPAPRFGPYRVVERLWETESEALFLAYDDVLRRKIWVHKFRDAAQAPPVAWLAKTSLGRLHWLQGSRAIDNVWDAYEAPSGAGFTSWVKAQGRLSWHEVSRALSGVLAEIDARLKEEGPPAKLSLDYIWVQANGQAIILDFPAMAGVTEGEGITDLANWRDVIHQMLLFGLEGRLVRLKDLGSRLPGVPFPEYARGLINSICQAGPASQSPEKLVAALDGVSERPWQVTARKRFDSLGPFILLSLFILAFQIPFIFIDPRWYFSRGDLAFSTNPGVLLLLSGVYSVLVLSFFSCPGIIFAFILRGGLLFSLFGIAVQRADGSRASRLRCFLRAVVAWLPLLVIFLADIPGHGFFRRRAPHPSVPAWWLMYFFPALVVTVGAIYALARPERGIQDRIAGTYLVPK